MSIFKTVGCRLVHANIHVKNTTVYRPTFFLTQLAGADLFNIKLSAMYCIYFICLFEIYNVR